MASVCFESTVKSATPCSRASCLSTAARNTHEHTHKRTHIVMKWTVTLAVAGVLMYLDAVQSVCTDPWTDLEDNTSANPCFYFGETKATWYQAKAACEAMSTTGHLARPTGDSHQKIIAYINAQPEGDLDDEAFWLGGSDYGHTGRWEWEDGTEIPLGPPHWYLCNGQPNNPTTQHYLALYTPDFYFHSLEESRQIRYICGQ